VTATRCQHISKDVPGSPEYQRLWKHENRERVLANRRAYRARNLKREREYQRNWRRLYYAKNRDECRRYAREWRARDPEKARSRKRSYDRTHRKQLSEKTRVRFKIDPNFRLRNYLGSRVNKAIKRKSGKKVTGTILLLGCSIENLWLYLESKFELGMTRANYGRVWHVDHIMPCAIFDLTKPEHQRRCFHFSNLQPMFDLENKRKGAKVLSNQFLLL
jgi:hypothetical protein